MMREYATLAILLGAACALALLAAVVDEMEGRRG